MEESITKPKYDKTELMNFEKMKIKMVMRIYQISRAEAKAYIKSAHTMHREANAAHAERESLIKSSPRW